MHIRKIKGRDYLYDGNKFLRKVGLLDRFFLNKGLYHGAEIVTIVSMVILLIFFIFGLIGFWTWSGVTFLELIFWIMITFMRGDYEK